ncbi:MAG: preprotein translocase subunit SecE [Coprothermobacterota bacterium]|jgi:preprotein translocase subunit SecE|nr:preprotein translocase subunit SecE [Coprothermobacterota bacterium]
MNTERNNKTARQTSKPLSKAGSRKEKKSIGQRLATYAINVKNELKRVSWPTRKAIINSTATVIIFVIVFAVYIGLWDYLFAYLMQSIVTR